MTAIRTPVYRYAGKTHYYQEHPLHLSIERSADDNRATAALNLMLEDARRVKVMDLQGASVSLGCR